MPDPGTLAETAPLYRPGALPVNDGEYLLQVEPLGDGGFTGGLMIKTDRLTTGLLSRGCEFCAQAVKLGRAVYCDHPPVTRTELEDLGVKHQRAQRT